MLNAEVTLAYLLAPSTVELVSGASLTFTPLNDSINIFDMCQYFRGRELFLLSEYN